MAPASFSDEIKNVFAKASRHLKPSSSRTPSRSTSSNPAKPPTAHQALQQHNLKDSAETAWKTMETALRLLEKGADACPPLKSTVGGLVACLDLAKKVIGNREEYAKLAAQFEEMASTLAPYASKLAATDARGSIALILTSIDDELAEINRQLERGKFKRAVEATDDQGDILTRYRKIDSLFRRLLSDVTLRTHVEIGKLREATDATLLRTLVPVDDARYNSAYSTAVKRRGCTASTREQILDDLRTWVKDPQGSKVFWMNGMAGTGKTTILYSFCEWLEENKRLAGNFFCSRASTSCRDLNNIVRSIAYQLAHYSPAFRSQLCEILEEKQNPHTLNVGEQFKWVMAMPLENSKDAIPDGAIIVVDALDECGDVSATALFLKVLMSYATRLPIKFLVASRPEPVILKNMQTPNFSPSILRLHDIEQSLVEADIRLYLQEALFTMSPSPSAGVIERLTRRSGKLFIYAATVARYINPEDKVVNSKTRLDTVLGISSSSASLQEQELDKLYTTILLSAFDKVNFEEEELEIASLVLRTVICAIEPMTTRTMSTILALRRGDVASTLSRLQSVLHVQEGPPGLVSVLHASFPDFLCNEARSREFYCNILEHNTMLTHSCFDVMCKELHFNMCDLESSYDFDEDLPDLAQKIKANISVGLLYACKYWSNHLVHCDLTSSIHYRLVEFLKFRLLFWMEVLNLTKAISVGSKLLSDALAWLIRKVPDHTFKETEKELYDADLFVKTFSLGACKKSTPHIYISALPFCYKSSSVYQNYWSKTHGLLVVNGTSLIQRRNGPIGVWKTDMGVNSVAFSLDDRTFAAACGNCIKIHDVQSGDIVFSSLLEDGASIMTLVFSPDNSKIATGSRKGNIWVWDIQTAGLIAGPLHMEGVGIGALAFSWDGRKLAAHSSSTLVVWELSSSKVVSGPFETTYWGDYGSFAFTPDDSKVLFMFNKYRMVYILDARSGSDLAVLLEVTSEDAGLGTLRSTAISPDTTLVAVGYEEGMICIWEVHAGTMIQGLLVGHSGWVSALAFSHDGKKLISGSADTTIRIWDIDAGDVVAGPLKGHTGTIHSLALSSDGTKIISGSWDECVCLWNVFSNESNVAPPCQSVTGYIRTVAWSPDSTRIASGQHDGTVAVWSAQEGEAVIKPFRHSSDIFSIAFSPDSSRISAGTEDGAVVSWDLRTREIVGEPFQGHSRAVKSVVYSPDGSIIASGSDDCTIIIWDCSTGKMFAKLLGHKHQVDSVSFTPDGSRLVSSGHDKSIYVWNVHTGQIILGPIEGHKDTVCSVACSPEQPRFVSGSSDGTLRVWNLTTGEMTAGPFNAHCGAVYSVAYSRDGTKIIYGGRNRNVCVCDAETGNILASIAGHTQIVISVAVSPDGSRFISGSNDRSVRVWQLDILTSPESLQNAPTIWMPEHDIIPTNSDIAGYQDDGWVDLYDMHSFWTTPEFRQDLCYPLNPITIGPCGTTLIDYSLSNLLIGQMWSKCWIYGLSVSEKVESVHFEMQKKV
ncbi:hypothetical protein D9613_008187 [Agrocybe pediades]|uniref:Nephrocystin 3-like N-terminal domain-containing protein n=1 Tax=Agrocybe pediades TaxID=84607 RepID=A0A8H4QML6_9AGAR|nr:hypothetical protein D9613_008187 [Agrocybe pediades]